MKDRFEKFNKANNQVSVGVTAKEVTKKKRKNTDINVKEIGDDLYSYIESTGISISKFVRMAIKEKMDRDST